MDSGKPPNTSFEALHEASAVAAAQTTKLVALNEQSAIETQHVAKLTQRMERLTTVMTWLTVVAAVFGGVQTIAILVHLYRWWRGWL